MNLATVIQTAGTPAVACSDLLACFLLWLVRLLLLVTLVIEIKVLTMLYKDKRENEQRRRESDKCPSEINQNICAPLQPAAGNISTPRRGLRVQAKLTSRGRQDSERDSDNWWLNRDRVHRIPTFNASNSNRIEPRAF